MNDDDTKDYDDSDMYDDNDIDGFGDDNYGADGDTEQFSEHPGSGFPCKATSIPRTAGRLTSIHRRSSIIVVIVIVIASIIVSVIVSVIESIVIVMQVKHSDLASIDQLNSGFEQLQDEGTLREV